MILRLTAALAARTLDLHIAAWAFRDLNIAAWATDLGALDLA